jgi:hypothetical protein
MLNPITTDLLVSVGTNDPHTAAACDAANARRFTMIYPHVAPREHIPSSYACFDLEGLLEVARHNPDSPGDFALQARQGQKELPMVMQWMCEALGWATDPIVGLFGIPGVDARDIYGESASPTNNYCRPLLIDPAIQWIAPNMMIWLESDASAVSPATFARRRIGAALRHAPPTKLIAPIVSPWVNGIPSLGWHSLPWFSQSIVASILAGAHTVALWLHGSPETDERNAAYVATAATALSLARSLRPSRPSRSSRADLPA